MNKKLLSILIGAFFFGSSTNVTAMPVEVTVAPTIDTALVLLNSAAATIAASTTAAVAQLKLLQGPSPAVNLATLQAVIEMQNNLNRRQDITQRDQDRINSVEVEKQKLITTQSYNGAYLPAGNTCADRAAANVSAAADATVTYTSKSFGVAAKRSVAKAPAPKDQLANAVKEHRTDYCDPKTDPKRCDGNAPTNTYEKDGKRVSMPDGDTDSKSLFDGAGDETKAEGNLTYTKEQSIAAAAYVKNAIDSGDTPRGLSAAEFDTEEGRAYHGLKLAFESRVGLSRNILTDIHSARAPIKGSEGLLDEMVSATSTDFNMREYITNRQNEIKKFGQFKSRAPVSPMEIIDIQVKSRSDNAAWWKYINNAAPDQVRKEQAVMMAIGLRMQYMQLRQSEMLSAIQAINAAEATKANMQPRLQSALNNLSRR